MPTLIDTLSSQGKATDYNSRKAMYESLGLNKTYGNYTGAANQNIGFMNVLQKTPNPAQLNGNVPQVQGTTTAGFQPIKGFSKIQNQYAEQMATQPDYQSMYGEYSKQTGLADVKNLILNIDNTVADVEDKIAKIEPSINKEVGNYLINENQRAKMVNAEELPLRTQYADILRSRARLSAEATSKAELVNTMMSLAKENYSGRSDYLKTLMDIEKSNKSSGSGSDSDWIKALLTKNQPTEAPKPLTNEDLGGFIKEPLSEKGKSGKVLYTTPNGVQVKWNPLDNTWVRYNADYEKKLKSIGL